MCMLSICMITYNQELFVVEAIESVVHQKTEFPFELVISDDCSTDSTPSIIQSYKQQYPELIRIIHRAENLGMIANFLQTIRECKSKYVAFLEGDDYWTDNHKLQKQVDLLEKVPGIAVCSHPVRIKNQQTGTLGKLKTKKIKRLTSTKDILTLNYIATCSVVFRNLNKGVFPDWIRSLSMGDWPVHILNSLHGDIYCLPEYMGVYRVHDTSGWSKNLSSISGKIKTTEKKLELFMELKNNFPAKWQGIISSQISTYQKLIAIYSRLGENKDTGINTWLWLTWKSLTGHFDSRVCLKVIIKSMITR
jgi:glycosyltransferase involved in cell wall biosynthesis